MQIEIDEKEGFKKLWEMSAKLREAVTKLNEIVNRELELQIENNKKNNQMED